jgi:hypothetical protein
MNPYLPLRGRRHGHGGSGALRSQGGGGRGRRSDGGGGASLRSGSARGGGLVSLHLRGCASPVRQPQRRRRSIRCRAARAYARAWGLSPPDAPHHNERAASDKSACAHRDGCNLLCLRLEHVAGGKRVQPRRRLGRARAHLPASHAPREPLRCARSPHLGLEAAKHVPQRGLELGKLVAEGKRSKLGHLGARTRGSDGS